MFQDVLLLQGGNAGTFNLLFFGAMFLIIYLFMIRPQSKRQNEQKKFMAALEKGDDVVTSSGMLGKINKIEDEVITLEVGNKTYIRVTRNAISKEMTDSLYADQ
ncbi:MAG: preprotein translocase subunit YajC [Saprospiraceae bacterium]|nr:preprotein translocase subunit YajC [Saprospiraceae bacterium]